MKIALIGIGYWGRNHLRSLLKIREEGLISEIVVCDIDQEALVEIRDNNKVEIESNWHKLLEDEELKLVNIVSPSQMHYEMAKQFMLKGKDILIEKPMAMSSKECDELIKISQETGSGIMVGHIFRFHSAVNELKRRIEQNEFGEIICIKINRQTLRKPRKDMGVMLALGIHEVDLTCYLLGDKTPDSIFADMNSFYGNTEEMALIIQKFGKTTAYSYETWIDPTEGKLRELLLIGKKGSARINFNVPDEITLINSYLEEEKGGKDKIYSVIDGGNFVVRLEYQEPLLEEIRHFIEESKREKQYRADAKIGKRAVKMIEKAMKSNETRQIIDY